MLALTYDDGPGQIEAEPGVPGPRTLELAKYLHEMNIRATFFVIGKHAAAYGKVLEELAGLGHLVGNHTYSHPSGDPRDASGWAGDRVDHFAEIQRTHEIIKPYVVGKFFFRAPGDTGWPIKEPHVIDRLNRDPELRQYTGPVGWNIESQDWLQWQAEGSAKDAVAHIRGQIDAQGSSGIILMHDCSTEQPETQTLEHIVQAGAHGHEFTGRGATCVGPAEANCALKAPIFIENHAQTDEGRPWQIITQTAGMLLLFT